MKKLIEPVYIHFDFDDYKPDLMMKDERHHDGRVRYYVYRMVPPGKIYYFFTINHEAQYAQDHPKIAKKIKFKVKNIEFDELVEDDGRPPDSDEEEEEKIFSFSLGVMNFTSGRTKQVLDEEYEPIPKH